LAHVELRSVQNIFDERNVSLYSSYSEFVKSSEKLLASSFECSILANNFSEQGIIIRGDDRSLMAHTIKPDPRTTRRSVNTDSPRIWFESLLWIFGGNSALNSMTPGLDLFLFYSNLLKRSASCDHDLCLNDINTTHLFGNGMFNLNSWVDFDEIEFAAIFFNQKLYCSRVLISNVLTKPDCAIQYLLSNLRVQS